MVKRLGITLVEILVAVSVLAILGAAVISSINPGDKDDQARIELVGNYLQDLVQAIAGFEPTLPPASFKQTVGVFPNRLSHLTRPITTSDFNSCGTLPYTQIANVDKWVGPYWARELLTTGNKIATGFVMEDLLLRNPAAAPPSDLASTLAIRMLNVAADDAKRLALYVDGDSTGTVGSVRFTLSAQNPVTVEFRMRIKGC